MCGSTVVSSAEEEEVLVPEVRVTYTRGEQDPRKIPASVTIIEREVIEKSGATTVPDLLRREAGINVQSLYGNNKYTSLDLRGFARGFETLVMLNGVRLNAPNMTVVDWSLIPMDAVERIEIIKGPGTALWGDSATAGVINIITKKGYDVPLCEVRLTGGCYGRFDSTMSLGYSNEWARIFLTGGYHTNDGFRENSQYQSRDISASLGVSPTDFLEVSLDFGYVYDEYEMPGGIYDTEIAGFGRDYSYWYRDEGHGERFYTMAGLDLDFESVGRVEIDYSYKRDRNFYNNPVSITGVKGLGKNWYDLNEHGLYLKYIWDFDHGWMGNRLTTGVDLRRTTYRGDAYNDPFGIDYYEKYRMCRETVGVYAYDELTLIERVVVSVAYRYEYMRDRYDFFTTGFGTFHYDGTERYGNQALSAGITFLFGDEGKVYFRFSRGYRMPLLEEFVVWGTGPNLSIKPERVTGYELGVEHGTDLFGCDVSLSLLLYWDEYTDELYYDPNVGWGANLNYERTVHRGIDVGVEVWPCEGLKLYATYSFQDAFFDYEPYRGNRLPLVPKHMVSGGASFDYKGFSCTMDCRWVGNRVLGNDLVNEHQKLDDYFVMDARFGYTYRWMELFFGVNNITDEEYSDYAGWLPNPARGEVFEYPLPGRSFYGGIAVRF
jgi:iron complex outermembrane receptor protein